MTEFQKEKIRIVDILKSIPTIKRMIRDGVSVLFRSMAYYLIQRACYLQVIFAVIVNCQ